MSTTSASPRTRRLDSDPAVAWRAFFQSVPLYADDDDPAFWADGKLRGHRDTLLRRQMSWLATGSPHYSEKFKAAGIAAEAIQSTDDLQLLPVTTKHDLMADPVSFRLRLPHSDIYDMTYATVYTTGTTLGRPTPYEYTGHDFLGALLAGRRTYKHLGLRPGDRLLILFPLSPLPHVAGFVGAFATAAGLSFSHGFTGMPYPEFAVHRPAGAVFQQLRTVRPDAIAGISSFLRRMLAEAAANSEDLSFIKVVIAGGEVLTSRMREYMRENLAACGAPDVFVASTYGFTEGAVAWVPSTEDGPLYAVAPDQVFLEILHPETHQRLSDGEPGLVALTHLNRRGMPLVRYLLGDISALSHEPCPQTGRRGEALLVSSGSAHVTRTNQLLKVKGTLINPDIVHEIVMNTPGVLEYQVVVTNDLPHDPLSAERLVLRIGLSEGIDPNKWADLDGRELRHRVRGGVELTPEVEIVQASQIFDPERDFKASRILDLRRAD